MATAGSLHDVLARPMQGAARVVIIHEVHRAFRPMVILELTLCFIGCIILLPCLALMMVGGGNLDALDWPEFTGRWHDYWRMLIVRVLDPQGRVLAEAQAKPQDEEEGEALVATVLDAARRERVVVVESIRPVQSQTLETRAIYYGGQPLMASPDIRHEQAAAQVLTTAGLTVEPRRDEVLVRQPLPRVNAVVAWFILVFLVCPLLPFMLIVPRWRRGLAGIWSDATGGPPPERIWAIRAESLAVRDVRGEDVREERLFDGADLLSVVYAPSLSWARRIARLHPALTVVTRTGETRLDAPSEQAGPALRDLVLASTLRLRAERPELGLLGGGPRPIRCPYCAHLYELRPGVRCPSCGAPATLA